MIDRVLRWIGSPAQWRDPRGIRLWSVVLVVVYTLAGFFVAPYVVERTLPGVVEKSLSRHASVKRVRINPFVLSAELDGFRLDDTDGSLLFGFKRLYVNFQSTSLFHWAWTFSEIRLDKPSGRLVRDKEGVINVARLLAGIGPARASSKKQSSAPRLLVGQLVLDNGSISVLDQSRPTPFERDIGPINVTVRNLSTLPEDQGTQQVAIEAGGIRIGWNGKLELMPLWLMGHVTAKGPVPVLAYDYLKDQFAFTVPSGDADIGFDYAIGQPQDQPLTIALSGITVAIHGLRLRDEDGNDIADLPLVRLDGGRFAWPAQKIHANRLLVDGLSLSVVRAGDGTLNILNLLRSKETSGTGGRSEPSSLDAWDVGLDALDIDNLHVGLEDETLSQPGHFEVKDANVSIDSLSNKPGARFPVDATLELAKGGHVHVQGDVSVLPEIGGKLEVSATGLACSAAQPWVGSVMRVKIDEGKVGANANVELGPHGGLAVSGDFSLAALAISDAEHGERILGWQSVAVDRYEYQRSSNRLEISTIDVKKPYSDLVINKDHTTNVQRLVVEPDAPGVPGKAKAPTSAKPLELRVGRVRVEDGSADFADHSLPLPFHAGIKALAGEITTISTTTSTPARVRLQGQVGNWGLAQIKGAINPLGPTMQTNVGVVFRNIDFPDLSPYTIKFAGRRIASGRLDLNLHYKLDKGKLDGKNNIVIHDFKLGDKVKAPGALDLPLGLAVALLEDKNGKIDLDLPVTGDVDNPDFKISGVIMKAFGNIITGIVTSPFRLLGKLVGGGATEDFGEIDFEPGLADLSPPEKEKLAKLARALTLRPALSLKVPGSVSPDLDGIAMRKLRVDGAIAVLVQTEAKSEKSGLYAELERQAVQSLFLKQFPNESLTALQKQYTSAPKDDPKAVPKLDEQAYLAAMRQRLIDAQVVGPEDLSALADARANAIVGAITAVPGIDPARVVPIARAGTARPTKAGWVPVKLDVDVSRRGQP